MATTDDGWEEIDTRPEPKIFPAAYPGACADCGGSIEEGDAVGYLDDQLCCEDCVILA